MKTRNNSGIDSGLRTTIQSRAETRNPKNYDLWVDTKIQSSKSTAKINKESAKHKDHMRKTMQ